MKLLYIHQYFAFPDIHSSTRSYDLATAFVKNKITVTIITTTVKIRDLDQSKRWNYFEKEGLAFWVLTSNYSQKMNTIQRLRSFMEFMFFASIKALRIKADLVLATSTPITVAVPALIKKLFSGTTFVFEIRDVWPDELIKMGFLKNKILIWCLTKFEKLIYKKAYFLVPLSIDMQKSIIDRNPAVEFKLEVIPNISEINRFHTGIKPFNIGLNFDLQDRKAILYAGAIGRANGIKYVADLAIETYKIDKRIVFIIIGVGNEKELIVKYCEEHNILNENIFFLDPVPKDSLPYLYSVCTMGSSFVINNPALWANSANKFFDTLAAGKPVLINYNGWQADLIRCENLGYILPPELSANAVQSFCSYLNAERLLEEQSKNALEAARRHFSLDVAVQKYLNIFTKFSANNV